MTATPTHIEPYISKFFKEICKRQYDDYYLDETIKISIPNKTTNFNVRLFDEVDQLITIINSSNYTGKWLIFVSSKAIGKKISNGLSKEFNDKIFIDADYIKYGHYKEKEEVNKIIEEEYSSKKIIICTSVLDNGINIKDETLRNIVIMTTNQIEFLQMLGRKRNIDYQTNLFLCTGDKSYFRHKKNAYFNLYKMLTKYKHIENKNILHFLKETNVQTETLVNFYNQKCINDKYIMTANELAIEEIKNRFSFNSKIVSQMTDDKYAFVKQQFDWLGIPYPESEEGFLSYYGTYPEEDINQIVCELESEYDKIIIFGSKDDKLSNLHNKLLDIAARINPKFSKLAKIVNSINKALKEIPYCKEYELSKIADKINNENIDYYELLKNKKSKINIRNEITLDTLKEIVKKYDDLKDDCFEEITGLKVPEGLPNNPRILIQIINLKMKNVDELKENMIKKQSGKILEVVPKNKIY